MLPVTWPTAKVQKGNIPPLAGSEWLKGSPDRSIAISLRGLAGPIKVNDKKYYAAMPPQLLFDDEKLAYILSYVNNAWGNHEDLITKEQVAKARKELPLDVFTPQTLLKRFPFEKKYSKKKMALTHRLSMTHSRTLLRRWFTVLLCLVPHQPPSP